MSICSVMEDTYTCKLLLIFNFIMEGEKIRYMVIAGSIHSVCICRQFVLCICRQFVLIVIFILTEGIHIWNSGCIWCVDYSEGIGSLI